MDQGSVCTLAWSATYQPSKENRGKIAWVLLNPQTSFPPSLGGNCDNYLRRDPAPWLLSDHEIRPQLCPGKAANSKGGTTTQGGLHCGNVRAQAVHPDILTWTFTLKDQLLGLWGQCKDTRHHELIHEFLICSLGDEAESWPLPSVRAKSIL